MNKFFVLALLLILLISVWRSFYVAKFITTGDLFFHISIMNEIRHFRTLPPNYPCLSDSKVMYSWFPHLIVSLISIYSNIPVLAVLPYLTLFMSVLFSIGCFICGRLYFKDTNLSTLFMLLMFLYLGAWKSFSSQYFAYMLYIPFFYAIFKFIEDKSYKFGLLAGFTSASLMYFHPFSSIFTGIFIFAFCLYELLENGFKNIKHILILVLPLVLILPHYLSVSPLAESAFIFLPFGMLFFNYFEIMNIFLLLFIFGAYMTIKDTNRMRLILLAGIIVVFVFVNTVVLRRIADIARFLNFLAFPICLISLPYFRKMNNVLRYSILVLCVFLAFYPMFMNSVSTTNSVENFYESDKYKIAEWIRERALPNDVILSAPVANYIAVTETRAVLCEPIFLMDYFVDTDVVKNRFADLVMMYTYPSQDLYKKYNVTHVLLGPEESTFFEKYDLKPYNFSDSYAFEEVSRQYGYAVYKPTDMSFLPESVNKTIRSNLNFTSYSRWFVFN